MSAIIFDLDGTLIDSAPDIRAATNRMLADEGKEPLDLKTITSFIGNGLPKLVERAMAARGIDAAEHPRLSQVTLDYYNEAPSDLTELYPGVLDAIKAFRAAGHRIGLCTNKPEEPARAILRDFGVEDLFDVVIGGDTLTVKKPDPAPLKAAFEALGQEGLYVGDSEIDAETAERAGVPFALFTEGYRKVPVEDMTAAVTFAQFDALPDLAKSVLN